MNLAPSRPRRWSPQVVLFAVALHAVVLYYVAASFHIVPPLIDTTPEPPTVQAVRLDPLPPVVIPDEPPQKHPRVIPRQPLRPPVRVDVQPMPFPPQPPAISTANADVMVLNTPIQEAPVSQILPAYPRLAQERDVEGRVVLSITIMPDGGVRDVEVVNAQPRGYFEEAAIRSVRTWRYAPSNLVRTRVIVHMDFQLRG